MSIMRIGTRTFGLFAVLLFGLPLVANAQRKEITQAEFQKVHAFAEAELKNRIHRTTTIMETYADEGAKPEEVRKWITESAPPDQERTFFELTNAKGVSRSETIRIAGRRFVKKGDGDWEEIKQSGGLGSGFGSGSSNVQHFYLGEKEIKGNKADVYELSRKNPIRIKGEQRWSITKSTYWFGKNGLLLKKLRESDHLITKRNRSTETYEYDVVFKIEPPIK